MQQPEQLSILGAVYGKQDVTNIVRGLVQHGSTQIQANNKHFGDSMPGVQKALVIVYQYGFNKPIVLVAKEGENVTIAPSNQPQWVTYQPGQVSILGAVYGLGNVTDKVAQRVQNNSLDIQAENSTLGDTWPGVHKILTVVYRDTNGEAKTAIAEENGKIKIEGSQYQYQQQPQYQYQQIPKILGAAYGKANITDQVRSMVANGNLQIKAANDIFGDTFEGVQKSLVVVYQFGDAKPQVGVAAEHKTLTLSQGNQSFPMNPQQGQVLGAAFGLADVTSQVASRIQNSVLELCANNEFLGDGWQGVRKTLVVVSQEQGNVSTHIVEEGGNLKISFQQWGGNLQPQYGNDFQQQQQNWTGGQPNYGGNYGQPQYSNNFQQQQQPQYQNNNNPYGGNQPQYGNYGQPQYGNNFQQQQPQINNPYGGYQQQQQFNNNNNQQFGGGYGGFAKQ